MKYILTTFLLCSIEVISCGISSKELAKLYPTLLYPLLENGNLEDKFLKIYKNSLQKWCDEIPTEKRCDILEKTDPYLFIGRIFDFSNVTNTFVIKSPKGRILFVTGTPTDNNLPSCLGHIISIKGVIRGLEKRALPKEIDEYLDNPLGILPKGYYGVQSPEQISHLIHKLHLYLNSYFNQSISNDLHLVLRIRAGGQNKEQKTRSN